MPAHWNCKKNPQLYAFIFSLSLLDRSTAYEKCFDMQKQHTTDCNTSRLDI